MKIRRSFYSSVIRRLPESSLLSQLWASGFAASHAASASPLSLLPPPSSRAAQGGVDAKLSSRQDGLVGGEATAGGAPRAGVCMQNTNIVSIY